MVVEAGGMENVEGRVEEDLALPVNSLIRAQVALGSSIVDLKASKKCIFF